MQEQQEVDLTAVRARVDAIIPQTYEWLDGKDQPAVTRLLVDDGWVAEQKLDGMRCMVRLTPSEHGPGQPLLDSEVRFHSHGGRPLVQAAAAQHFGRLRDALRPFGRGNHVVLDGEIMPDGTLVLFDLPFAAWGGGGKYEVAVEPSSSYALRRRVLEHLMLDLGDQDRVLLVPQAVGTEAKADLLSAVIESASEGVCFKDVSAPYAASGDRVRTVLKLKVKRTVDVFVTARNVGQGENVRGEMTPTKNAHLGVHDPDGSVRHLGSCTMIGKPDAQVGDVVEVEYLSWKQDGHLVQPNLLRIRDDKRPTECHTGQLVPSNRQVLQVLS